jgi:hypothetical protein
MDKLSRVLKLLAVCQIHGHFGSLLFGFADLIDLGFTLLICRIKLV